MSHYSVCVAIPGKTLFGGNLFHAIDDRLDTVLAPYDEQTENDEFREFVDCTDEAKSSFERDTIRVVRYPDGSLKSISDREFMSRFYVEEDRIYAKGPNKDEKSKLVTEESKALELVLDYPISKWYRSFEDYCESYHGYVNNYDGAWGYMTNNNAKWDWFQIGGRFHGHFLVKTDLVECVSCKDPEESEDKAPAGYKFVDAARKKDICWAAMQQQIIDGAKENFEKLEKAFADKDTKNLNPLTVITDDGIASWGTMLYLKGETLEDFLARKGALPRDEYQIRSYAFVGKDGEWHSSGDMGWFGLSSNDKPERDWNDELQKLMSDVTEDDFLVMVDCHI